MSTPGASNPAAATSTSNANSQAAQSTATAANPKGTNGPIPPGTGQNTGPAAAQPPRMIKLKLDGKEVEMSESDVISYAQQGKVANQRFQEAAAMKKQADDVLKFAKENPKEFFAKTGMNARDWAEKYLMEELTNDAMSPEQKKARENEEKLRKYEDSEKISKEKAQQDARDQMTKQKREEFDVMFTQALGLSGLPKTPFTVKRMAELQLINMKRGFNLDAGQLAKLVREDYASEQKSLLGSFDGDQLLEFLGPDTVKKLSKAQIAKLKSKGNPVSTAAPRTQPAQDQGGLTWAEYRKRNRKITPP